MAEMNAKYAMNERLEAESKRVADEANRQRIEEAANDPLVQIRRERAHLVFGTHKEDECAEKKEKMSAAVQQRTGWQRLVIITGPSGAGKTTLIERLMQAYPMEFGFSTSHTTRQPRLGEADGQYFFTTREAMQDMISKGEFIETCEVHGNFYGTSKMAVQRVLDENKTCLINVDVQGAKKIKADTTLPSAPFFLFIAPPSIEALHDRLVHRGTESAATIATRLGDAVDEIAFGKTDGFWDAVIVNDDLDEAYAVLESVLRASAAAAAAAAEHHQDAFSVASGPVRVKYVGGVLSGFFWSQSHKPNYAENVKLLRAAYHGELAAVVECLRNGATALDDAMFCAVIGKFFGVARFLIGKGANPIVKTFKFPQIVAGYHNEKHSGKGIEMHDYEI